MARACMVRYTTRSGAMTYRKCRRRCGTGADISQTADTHVSTGATVLHGGAAIDATDQIGCPPLWYSAYWGRNIEMTRFLCEKGADIGFRNIWDKGLDAYDCGWGHMYLLSNYRQ